MSNIIFGENFNAPDEPIKGNLMQNMRYIYTNDNLNLKDKLSLKNYLERSKDKFKSIMSTKEGFISIIKIILNAIRSNPIDIEIAYIFEVFLCGHNLMPSLSFNSSHRFRYDMAPEDIYDAWINRFLKEDEINFR